MDRSNPGSARWRMPATRSSCSPMPTSRSPASAWTTAAATTRRIRSSPPRPNLVLFLTEEDQLSDTDFDPADGTVDVIADEYEAGGTTPEYSAESYTNDVWAEGKGGTVFHARIGTGVHTQGADCTFSGIFSGPTSSGALRMVNRMGLDAGDTATLFQTADFKVTAECVDTGAGNYVADASWPPGVRTWPPTRTTGILASSWTSSRPTEPSTSPPTTPKAPPPTTSPMTTIRTSTGSGRAGRRSWDAWAPESTSPTRTTAPSPGCSWADAPRARPGRG